MIDGMSGIKKLRKLANDTDITAWIALKSGVRKEWGAESGGERLSDLMRPIVDQIEREHAEELAAAKRDLTDEAREAVERLRAVSHDDILRSANPDFEIVREIGNAVGASWIPTYTSKFDAISDRIIELIEYGGKQDVDVSALRELADKMSAKKGDVLNENTSKSFRRGAIYGIDDAPERIRKAVEGAPKPDAESDAERACAALMEWRDQVAGLLGIDYGSMADEVQDAIMAELDKRLMPPGMEWPRFEDGERVDIGDEFAWAGNAYECDAVKLGDGFALHCDEAPSSWYGYSFTDSVKRPEPEVLGADKLPIKVGETVWDSTSPNDPTSSTVWRHGGPLKVLRRNDVRAGFVICENDQGIPLDCLAAELTHAAPDTQARIDGDKRKRYDAYWKCDADITCCECPAVIDGMKPYEYYGVLNCKVAQGMDIARRKHELAAKTTGGE